MIPVQLQEADGLEVDFLQAQCLECITLLQLCFQMVGILYLDLVY